MDPAVRLVESYLRLNGYFTVTEYAIQWARPDEPQAYVQATDIDILAVRLPRAQTSAAPPPPDREPTELVMARDPELEVEEGLLDILIGEVKEGEASFNRVLTEPRILHAAVDRVGCCGHQEVPRLVEALRREMQVRYEPWPGQPARIRLVSFSGQPGEELPPEVKRIALGHVLRFISGRLERYREVLSGTQFKDDILALFQLLTKLEAELSLPE